MLRSNELLITKRVRHPENWTLGQVSTMDEFIAACQVNLSHASFEQKTVALKKPQYTFNLNKHLIALRKLSFEISLNDVTKICNQILEIVSDPFFVASLLKDLEAELAVSIKDKHINFSDNDAMQFLIAVYGHYAPGPPPENYHPKKKGKILEEILLEREKKRGINTEGETPIFVGGVNAYNADKLVSSGHVFTENKQIAGAAVHGAAVHRLMLDALCVAVEKNQLDLRYDDGKVLGIKQLLEMLTHGRHFDDPITAAFAAGGVEVIRGRSLWDALIDQVPSSSNRLFDPKHYNFNCGDPAIFNSLLLCFGKELGLPQLQHYLLDSHWKAIYQMVQRVRSYNPSINIPDSRIYTYCMEAFADIDQFGKEYPFTLNVETALSNPSYERFNEESASNIVKKKKQDRPIGEYASWGEFFNKSKGKYPKSNKPNVPSDTKKVEPAEPTSPPKDLEEAFNRKDKPRCERFIREGVDFYKCKVKTPDASSQQLFNELCNTQAQYNIQNLKATIFNTRWGNYISGKTIYNEGNQSRKVPATVALEWMEIMAAEKGEKTYYAAWKKVLSLRQESCWRKNFFRNNIAEKHYRDVSQESEVPWLKKGTKPSKLLGKK